MSRAIAILYVSSCSIAYLHLLPSQTPSEGRLYRRSARRDWWPSHERPAEASRWSVLDGQESPASIPLRCKPVVRVAAAVESKDRRDAPSGTGAGLGQNLDTLRDPHDASRDRCLPSSFEAGRATALPMAPTVSE